MYTSFHFVNTHIIILTKNRIKNIYSTIIKQNAFKKKPSVTFQQYYDSKQFTTLSDDVIKT